MADDEPDHSAPLLDGRYRLGECVGEGGMARVYRSEDVLLGRTVAIKLIRPGVDSATSDRARSEMTLLASLNHPSLVTLYDARLEPGQPEYLVMEFVEGPTLGARLASGPLPPEIVAHLAAELAEALHVVHSAGIVHRDIKPSNVLLSPPQLPGSRPRAKLADFGIALLLDGSRLTSPGLVIGTVAYLSPEQLRGREPAPPGDIYSLGLVLLEALTGERDHPQGGGMPAALARLENPPVVPASLPSGWGELLTRMLHSEPSQRPTAAQVAAAAARLAGSTPPRAAAVGGGPKPTATTVPVTAATLIAPVAGVAAAPGPGPNGAGAEPPRPHRSRRRLLVGIGAALAAAAVVVAAILGIANLGGQQPEPVPTAPANDVPADTPTPTDDGNDVVVDPGLTEEERKELEETRKKAEEEARKQAEEDRKKAEEEQKKLEEEQKRQDDSEDGQNGDD
ncbi:serine/threonine protein kinase [Microbacterium sp. CFH 90308]|uniref:non-specific serine/threonine protein kinase n=1 Tax=Microbacterium salsuginis TaxID=2722803 RepID=A0ABX1K7N7_9MICO|nr:serine/threonine-protein kinase [Microbacterium sp. CFH 90308]NLP83027.1 serine/threonine protein kinase [Microbacterium sp. CFH 90308]